MAAAKERMAADRKAILKACMNEGAMTEGNQVLEVTTLITEGGIDPATLAGRGMRLRQQE
ncbi:MAG: hypothetical protein QXD27_09445 [Metallosphaera sp.]